MKKAVFGDLAFIKNPAEEAGNMIPKHFGISQELALPPTPPAKTTIVQNYQLSWVFYDEYIKIVSQKYKLRLTGFDFSKYFYVLKNPSAKNSSETPTINSSKTPQNMQISMSGGNGNIPLELQKIEKKPSVNFTIPESILEEKELQLEKLALLNFNTLSIQSSLKPQIQTSAKSKLIYLCEAETSSHAKSSIAAVESIFGKLPVVKYINIKFSQTTGIGAETNFYLAMLHAFIHANPYDIILINSSFDFNSIQLPLCFDRLLNDMFTNLMNRNITVILSAGNSKIKLETLDDRNNDLIAFKSKTSQQNKSAIIVGGISSSLRNIESNQGSIVDCYFSRVDKDFGESSAGSAKAAGMVLKMQEYAMSKIKRYLKSDEIKRIISYNGINEPNFIEIKDLIDGKSITT